MEKELLLAQLKEDYPIDDDITFSDFNIEDKLQDQLKSEMKYWDLYQGELFQLSNIEDEMVDMKFIVYDYFKFEHDRALTKTEIESFYLPAHKDIKAIQKRIDLQQIKVDYFKICYNAVKQLRWNIHSYLKNKET
jgi:hypothetical protein